MQWSVHCWYEEAKPSTLERYKTLEKGTGMNYDVNEMTQNGMEWNGMKCMLNATEQ